jgi:hypothetical protein
MIDYFKIIQNGKITCIGVGEKKDKEITIKDTLTISDFNPDPFENSQYKSISKQKYEEYLEIFKFRKIRRILTADMNLN